jgi:hypothetical protein
MACECFEHGTMARCRAVAGTLIPSHFERETYCLTDGSSGCPTWRLYASTGTQLSQDAYYGLWIPPATRPAARERETRRTIAQPVD